MFFSFVLVLLFLLWLFLRLFTTFHLLRVCVYFYMYLHRDRQLGRLWALLWNFMEDLLTQLQDSAALVLSMSHWLLCSQDNQHMWLDLIFFLFFKLWSNLDLKGSSGCFLVQPLFQSEKKAVGKLQAWNSMLLGIHWSNTCLLKQYVAST